MSLEWPVFQLGSIDSTNSEAKRRANSGSFNDCWLVAESQSAGRGRLQRDWVSPAGNLFCTALFSEPGGIRVATRLPFAIALAVSDVFLQLAPEKTVKVKWPNDVRYERQKLSGVLIETGENDGQFWIAAGIGINVVEAPTAVSQEAACLAGLRGDNAVDAPIVLGALRNAFAQRLDQARQGFASVRVDWLERAEGLGHTVSVKVGDKVVEGVFSDMSDDGAIILTMDDGTNNLIRAGDVNLIGSG
ncbi:MAG: biotin--[acetyl-CoA-carboxylase] ligase [Hyphomonas sp.]